MDIDDIRRRITRVAQFELAGDHLHSVLQTYVPGNSKMTENLKLSEGLTHRVVLDRSLQSMVDWCLANIGDRYYHWTYRGGGQWAFKEESNMLWFRMVWETHGA